MYTYGSMTIISWTSESTLTLQLLRLANSPHGEPKATGRVARINESGKYINDFGKTVS